MIRNKLKNKNALEKATLKGKEFSKIKKLKKTKRSQYDIEIVETNAIDGGVEVFVRAWDSNGQIGFGKDGTVDIERFRIFNPPILVEDPNGDIVLDIEEIDGVMQQLTLREDHQEALLKNIEHTLRVKQEVFDDSKIIKDKRGNTTSTFYPDPDTESTSVDGTVQATPAGGDTWTNIQAHAGSSAADAFSGGGPTKIETDSDDWTTLSRMITLFDTSAIDDADEISSATYSLHGRTPTDNSFTATDWGVNVYSSAPASNTALAAGDFDSLGTTAYSDTAIVIGSWDTADYNDYTLNASGIAAISKTGITKLGARESTYDAPNSAPTFQASKSVEIRCYLAEETGTDKDPKLVVEHTAAASVANSNFFQFL